MSERLAGDVSISVDNLRCVNGVSAGLECISWMLCDPGDVILTPVPTYARWSKENVTLYVSFLILHDAHRLFADMQERVGAKVVGVNMPGKIN